MKCTGESWHKSISNHPTLSSSHLGDRKGLFLGANFSLLGKMLNGWSDGDLSRVPVKCCKHQQKAVFYSPVFVGRAMMMMVAVATAFRTISNNQNEFFFLAFGGFQLFLLVFLLFEVLNFRQTCNCTSFEKKKLLTNFELPMIQSNSLNW